MFTSKTLALTCAKCGEDQVVVERTYPYTQTTWVCRCPKCGRTSAPRGTIKAAVKEWKKPKGSLEIVTSVIATVTKNTIDALKRAE